MSRPEWLWEEQVQRGTDYEDMAEVEAYDARMGQVRDVEGECRGILELLALAPEDTVLEVGTGTGALARAAEPVAAVVTQLALHHLPDCMEGSGADADRGVAAAGREALSARRRAAAAGVGLRGGARRGGE